MIKGSSIYIQQILHKLDSLLVVILKNLATVIDPKHWRVLATYARSKSHHPKFPTRATQMNIG
jgi:hypothetical protein